MGLDRVWQFGLYAVDEKRTQLVSRSRVRAQTVWARLLTHATRGCGISHDATHAARSETARRKAKGTRIGTRHMKRKRCTYRLPVPKNEFATRILPEALRR